VDRCVTIIKVGLIFSIVIQNDRPKYMITSKVYEWMSTIITEVQCKAHVYIHLCRLFL